MEVANQIQERIRSLITSNFIQTEVKTVLFDLYLFNQNVIQEARNQEQLAKTGVTMHFGEDTVLIPVSVYNEMNEYMSRGQKIDAIKLLRQATNRGLKESKEVVDVWYEVYAK
jgi:hypothetical protein